eukprot:4045849-Amphidinium_carterae.1
MAHSKLTALHGMTFTSAQISKLHCINEHRSDNLGTTLKCYFPMSLMRCLSDQSCIKLRMTSKILDDLDSRITRRDETFSLPFKPHQHGFPGIDNLCNVGLTGSAHATSDEPY